MRIAISQPTYLPWMGYFDLIDQVDAFVFLDNVQFEKQSWQQRNRIKTPAGLQWLTVPVQHRGRFGQLINEVEIRDAGFWRRHLRAIELNYRRAPYFDKYFENLSAKVHSHSPALLAELNVSLIEWMMEALGVSSPLYRASRLMLTGRRTELLAKICNKLGADEYLSPIGSAGYLLNELDVLLDSGVEVLFQHYEHPQYGQMFAPFCANASALDLIFNEGEMSLQILRSGRRSHFLPAELRVPAAAEVSLQ
jgi:hypothetical protein